MQLTSVEPGDVSLVRSGGWTTAFVAFAIVITTNAFYPLFGEAPQTGTAEVISASSAATNPLHIGLRLVLWLSAGAIVARSSWQNGLRWPLLFSMPLVVLVFASALWSVSFTWTLYFASMFAANVVVAYAIALVVTPERFVRILAVTMGALIIASFVFLVVMPDLAMSSRWEGGWIAGIQFNGVFSHKSTSGIYFGLFLVVLWMSNIVTGFWRLVATAVTVLALLLSNSATGSVGAVALLVVFQVLRLAGFPTHVYMPLVGLLVFLFASFVPLLSFGEATELVGRDAGLTGRSPIWAAAGDYFLERPLLGYGYNGFFHPGDLSPVWRLWSLDRYFQTPHFHNSTIDVAISLGAVGVFVYGLTVMAGYLVTTNISIPIDARRALAGALTMMVLSTAFDMTIMAHNTFGTTLLFYCFYAGQIDYRR